MSSQAQFKSLVHYVCHKSPNPLSLGKTKLNKILWFAEREAYLETGHPITGVKFIKLPYGPVPEPIDETLAEMDGKEISIRHTQWNGKPKTEFISLRTPSTSEFTKEQLAIVDRFVFSICTQYTAESISERSHDFIWKLASVGDELPLYTVYGVPGKLQVEDIHWAQQQLKEIGLRNVSVV